MDFTIKGEKINSISDFYKEINRVFLPNEDWQLGESLDALDDMLYGGYGELKEASPALVIWENSEHCRQTLGVATTLQWHQEKLKNPKFNSEMAKEAIKNLQNGVDKTYFEIIVEIFESHKNIELILN